MRARRRPPVEKPPASPRRRLVLRLLASLLAGVVVSVILALADVLPPSAKASAPGGLWPLLGPGLFAAALFYLALSLLPGGRSAGGSQQ